jgi:hypothetical protein
MKKRVNISVGEGLHVEAIALARKREISFSALVSSLLRNAITAEVTPLAVGEVRPLIPVVIQPGPVGAPLGMGLLLERPAKNRPCPCRSGEKYKRCCEPHFPLISIEPRRQKSCSVSGSPLKSQDDSWDNQDD